MRLFLQGRDPPEAQAIGRGEHADQSLVGAREPRRDLAHRDDLGSIRSVGAALRHERHFAGGKDIAQPLRLRAVGQGDEEIIARLDDADRRFVRSARPAAAVTDDRCIGSGLARPSGAGVGS